MRSSSLLTLLFPLVVSAQGVLPLPATTGTHGVGTTVAYLTDATRRDADFPDGRPITLQVWYPAARAARANAPYLFDRDLGRTLLSRQYYGMDSATLGAWPRVRTHSQVGAPAARGTFPLVAYSVGLGVIRANYTSVAEELASHGYVVAMVESPMQGFMVRPNGVVVDDTTGRFGTPEGHLLGVEAWSRDISYALDALSSGRVKEVRRAIDWSRVGATGHSSGGMVALATCERDVRVKACVNMDGGVASPDNKPMAAFVAKGITKPALFLRSQPIYDDTTLKRRGMTREEWVKRGEAGRIAFDSLAARSKGKIAVAFVAGTGHFSFSDAPFVMPTAITRFGGRIIAPARGFTVISAAVRGFFDEALRGEAGALDVVVGRYPELSLSRP